MPIVKENKRRLVIKKFDYAIHFSNGINFATRPLSSNSMNIGEIVIGYVTERHPNEHSFTIQITYKEKEYNQLLYRVGNIK